jgi:preprotein translocase subunit SecE
MDAETQVVSSLQARRSIHADSFAHLSPFRFFQMNKVSAYFSESYKELVEKVTWPTWAQLQQSTLIVLVATVIITLVVGVMDAASKSVLKLVYSLFN